MQEHTPTVRENLSCHVFRIDRCLLGRPYRRALKESKDEEKNGWTK